MIMFDFVPAFKNADSTSFGQIFELPSHFALDLILWIHCCCGSTGSLTILQLYDYSIQYCPLQYPSAPPPGKFLRKRLLVPTTPSAWIWLWSVVLSICHLPFSLLQPVMKIPYHCSRIWSDVHSLVRYWAWPATDIMQFLRVTQLSACLEAPSW